MKYDISFSDSVNMTTGPSDLFYSSPTLDDINLDDYPDPEGYYDGQEEYGYDDDDYARDDDMYEPDFSYDG